MGVPAVKTKLLAYGTGAAFGGISGAFLASFLNTVNADQFQFYFSILVLAMVILGGLGSIWGVVLGAIMLSFVNNWLIPDVINDVPTSWARLRHDRDHLRGLRLPAGDHDDPQTAGPAPERRHQMELVEHADEHATNPLRHEHERHATTPPSLNPRPTRTSPSSSAA